ncbi:GH39 family glycosyl hydrolase [Kaarinaea lacus]
MTRIYIVIALLGFLALTACSSGGGGNGSNVGSDPDWTINIDSASAGSSLSTALLGHYDLSGALYQYDQVNGLVSQMQAAGFSEWRVGVGRWEISTEMLPTLSDGSPCPIDPLLTNSSSTDLDLINSRSWFIDNTPPYDTNSDSSYNLAYVRSVIDTALAFGAAPFVSIDTMPLALSVNQVPNRTDCTTSFMNAVTNNAPSDNLVFRQAVVGLVQRIVEGGGGEAGRPVTHWEIWNEPEFPYFWHEGLAARTTEFFDMASASLLALDNYRSASSNPDVQALKFGLASFASAATAVAAIGGFDAATVQIPFDFISFHSYHNDPLDIAADIELVANAVADSTHYQNVELVLAEWASDLDLTAGDSTYANSMQPPLVMATVITLGAASGLDRAHHSIFYDFHPGIALGLIDNNGTPKPLYRAYELLSEVITESSVMLQSGNAPGNQLGNNGAVLISRDSGGTFRALFINRDTNSHTASLQNAAGPMTSAQIKTFSDHTAPVATQVINQTTFTIPAQSLVMVEFL